GTPKGFEKNLLFQRDTYPHPEYLVCCIYCGISDTPRTLSAPATSVLDFPEGTPAIEMHPEISRCVDELLQFQAFTAS
ncbi:hypothetical protein LC049_21130, partial [Nitratireductor aquimarinus]|uniref:hypothetical protein n=1 Tax=Nitratireductor aquimarinus TaxID=889300 RepID=UPI001CD75165